VGAFYPAKDARMSAAAFQASYPRWQEIIHYIDPVFSSSFLAEGGKLIYGYQKSSHHRRHFRNCPGGGPQLGARGATLVLWGRSAERLEIIAADLRVKYGIEVSIEAFDLNDVSLHKPAF